MGKVGKGKTFIGVSVPTDWAREIDQRAAVLSLSRATYTKMIINYWRQHGQPPVSEPDKLMQTAKAAKEKRA